ncbi:MAG: DUF4203 domain-containing protein [Vicinamibacterales bacterium]
MLPHGYEQVAAVVLLLGGVLACFAGHRLFRIVMGIYGFILGAMIGSAVVGPENTTGMLVGAAVGGVVGSAVLVLAWFVGVALVGAGLGVLVAHLAWSQVASGDPPTVAIVAVVLAGAVGAMVLQKYVIVVGTAFAGAWTVVLAAASAFPQVKQGLTRGASDTEVWILYPTSTPGLRWAPIAWIGLGLIGTAVQLTTTASAKKRRR